MRLAVDANLALLLVVGLASPGLIEKHKRLAFTRGDFDLLLELLAKADCLVFTPNALTEVSNLADFGLWGTAQKDVVAKLRDLIANAREEYISSKTAAAQGEFAWLGLSDCAWLCALDQRTLLLTTDHDLYIAASNRGLQVTNFNHLREGYGTLP